MNDPAYVTVAVTFTDRTRAEDGSYNVWTRHPVVLVTDEDPTLVAAEMIACLIEPFDGMVLGTEITEVCI
jgi:hypothetical protein